MLTIECNPPQMSSCPCCGGTTTHLVRYVRQNGAAHAAYLTRFAEGHRKEGVLGLISLGSWGGKESRAEDRVAFGFRLWVIDGAPQVRIVSVSDTPWKSAAYFGKPLSREEALAHPLLPEVFHITDHIVLHDEPLRAYLLELAA